MRIRDENVDYEEMATKVLGVSFFLALLVVIALAIAPIGSGEQYTEFYILNSEGIASDYPQNVSTGDNAELRVGIGNFENTARTYTLVVRTAEATHVEQTIALDVQETWEEPVTIVFDDAGRKKLLFELYVGQSTSGEPYRSLWLSVEVTAR